MTITFEEARRIGPHGLITRLEFARDALDADHPFSGAQYDRNRDRVRDLEHALALIGWGHPRKDATS